MKIVALTPDTRENVMMLACQVLKAGGLVVYPTETTYGIGADCENHAAIEKLIEYKSKRDGKPISVAVDAQPMAEMYVELNETAKNVYKTFLPGPVTVISKSLNKVAPGVASVKGTVGIRIPKFPFVRELITKFGRGITATGANASYQKRPYKIDDILSSLSQKQKDQIDLIIDAGELPHNEPSTVIDTTLDDIRVTRFGTVDFTDKETFVTNTEIETKEVAQNLILRYRSKLTYSPILISLTGEMGAGKTHFTKGLAKGLAITEAVTSPTYSLANEYGFKSENRDGLLVHVDTWKMESPADLEALNLETFLARNAVVVVEWADRFSSEIEKLGSLAQHIWVDIKTINENQREIIIQHKK
jgi:L-threonylcarbamoyladenylate synthase